MSNSELERRKKILTLKKENPHLSQNDISKKLQIAKSTVQNVLANYNNTFSIERKDGSGRKPGSGNKNQSAKVARTFKVKPNASVRDVADKLSIPKSTVHNIKKKLGLKTFKVKSVPDRDENKEKIAKQRARRLYEGYLTKNQCIVMDDETYVKADFRQLPGQEYYVSKFLGDVDRKYKERKITKFPKKYLVWQAICSCGLKSRVFVTTGTVNQQIYTQECLQKRLLPLLQQHNISTVFWPDLATSHYGKDAMKWYHDNGVNIVLKDSNPPNCPELRPIERYWGLVKRELKHIKSGTVDEKKFKLKWKKASDKIDERGVRTLMEGVKRKTKAFFTSK